MVRYWFESWLERPFLVARYHISSALFPLKSGDLVKACGSRLYCIIHKFTQCAMYFTCQIMPGFLNLRAVFAIQSPKLMISQTQDPGRLFLIKSGLLEGPLQESDLEFPDSFPEGFSH